MTRLGWREILELIILGVSIGSMMIGVIHILVKLYE